MSEDLYRGPVVDPHHHLWTLAGDHYPWLRPDGGFAVLDDMALLQRDWLVEDYQRDTAGQHVVATVHIEALWDADDDPVNETRWLDTLSKDEGIAVRYVAACPFRTPDTERILRDQAAQPRVAGIRQVIAWHPDPARSPLPEPGITRDPEWRKGAALAEELGLTLDLLMFPWQAEEVVELAAAHPGLTIVVNHCASPIERGADDLAAWRRDVALLAGRPNTVVKVSSLATYDPEPTLESFEMVIDELVGAFGADRAMFASDHPVGTMSMSFADLYDLYRRAARKYSAEEQRQLFADTARRVYSIDV